MKVNPDGIGCCGVHRQHFCTSCRYPGDAGGGGEDQSALEAFGCTGGKMEKEDEDATLPYEVDDARCKSGEYDSKLDKNFNVIVMLRD